jgi:hypothetical protein
MKKMSMHSFPQQTENTKMPSLLMRKDLNEISLDGYNPTLNLIFKKMGNLNEKNSWNKLKNSVIIRFKKVTNAI